jgi:predicted phage terminase large subunit-like protein
MIGPQPGPQTAFLASRADIAIYGGAAGGGKSWALLLEPLRHVWRGDFGAVFFRRSTVQIRNEGGLWDESAKLYPHAGARAREQALEWRFPSGASVSFGHLEHERTVHDWQGSQIPLIGFDELTHFSARQFFYMLSRNRSMCGVRPYVRATCNPDADSWVAKLIAWWIDRETGLPIPERSGVLRWFARVGEELVWADRPEALEGESKSLTFIGATLDDNAALVAADPGYRASLMALPLVERERLLGGNWKIRPSAGMFFRREMFEIVDAVPAGGCSVRAWDFAGSEAKAGADPDWTVGVKVTAVPDRANPNAKTFYVEDVTRFRGAPAAVETALLNLASQDGPGVTIRLPQDPGQAGKAQAHNFVRALAGYHVVAKPVSGAKEVRAAPASAQAERGNVKLVRGAWNDAFLDELAAFPAAGHDDQVDALADAVSELALGGSDISGWLRWADQRLEPANRSS